MDWLFNALMLDAIWQVVKALLWSLNVMIIAYAGMSFLEKHEDVTNALSRFVDKTARLLAYPLIRLVEDRDTAQRFLSNGYAD